MNPSKACALALISLTLLPRCAARQPSPPPSAGAKQCAWVGAFNARAGAAHSGQWRVDLNVEGEAATGVYALPSDSCLASGKVSGTLQGGELSFSVTGENAQLEVKASSEGGSLFGVYRFIAGPCAGDWGSLAAKAESNAAR